MTPDKILLALKTDLEARWAASNKARVSLASDPWNVLELLVNGPAGLLLVLHWAGEDQLGDQEQAPLATQKIDVILACNLGPEIEKGSGLVKDTPQRQALLALVASLRDEILSLTCPDEETGTYFAYAGAEGVTTPEGIPLAAWKLSFRLDIALPDDTEYRAIAIPE